MRRLGLAILLLGATWATPASAAGQVPISVETVPPLAGVIFSVEGRTFVSGSDGVATLRVPAEGETSLDIVSLPSDTGVRVTAISWEDGSPAGRRQVGLPVRRNIQLGLQVSRLVEFQFADIRDRLVRPERVHSLSIRSSSGSVHEVRRPFRFWAESAHAVRRLRELQTFEVSYTVAAVSVDGSNVVNRSQHRFSATDDQRWLVPLLLYDVSFSARDALFGSSLGSGIRLQYPDGTAQYKAFDSTGRVELQQLARGDYSAMTEGVSGISPVTPLVISRDQHLELVVISHLDIAVVLSAGSVTALTLLFIGRPGLLRRLLRLRLPGLRSVR